jgi:hypothetical protein
MIRIICDSHGTRRGTVMEGKRFGKLVILEKTDVYFEKHVLWKLRCDCGNITYLTGPALLRGEADCGCNKSITEKFSLTEKTFYKP